MKKPYVYFQYKNAFAINTLLNGFYEEFEKVSSENLYNFLDIDAAEGLWLDQIGAYLNLPRPFIIFDEFTAFYDLPGVTYDSIYRYDGEGEPATDEVYRVLLKAEIQKRNSTFTLKEIADTIKISTSAVSVEIIEGIKILDITGYYDDADAAKAVAIINALGLDWFGTPTGVRINSFNIVIV